MRKSIKRREDKPTDNKIRAEIKDLYFEVVGNPPITIWTIEFSYTQPRSISTQHDFHSIEQSDPPTVEQWVKGIGDRFDCVSETSLRKGIANWIAKHCSQ